MKSSKSSLILNPEIFLRSLFDRAVEVADPMRSLAASLPERPAGRVVVVGAGKASARMAEAVEAVWGPCEGLVITRYGYSRPCAGIEIVEAAHPIPDHVGEAATARMFTLLESLGHDDYVLALISGGASALLVKACDGVSAKEKRAVHAALLASGAPIGQMNILRKHLSAVKGGKLAAAAYPARMLTLLVSDVPGDDPAFIGSGPTVGDYSTPAEAKAVISRWNIPVSENVISALGRETKAVLPDDERLLRVENRIIAAPSQSIAAAAEIAKSAGCQVEILGDALEGEARDFAKSQAQAALDYRAARKQGDPPLVLLSGGELTVTRSGNGIGGPNAEYCLALASALGGAKGIHAIACDTDGVDGGAEVAGAYVGPDTLKQAKGLGICPQVFLENNDAHRFFATIDAQIVTGPTLTNVNDFRATLII